MYVANGILFNHESPRRGETFVTRKITRALGRIRYGLQEKLYLGNLAAKRDWGFAGDYVEAMWLLLQQENPGDFVIATGETYSVRDFLTKAFEKADLDWQEFVSIDQRYFRPTEVDLLLGDPSRAKKQLGWEPRIDFDALVTMMVDEISRSRSLVVVEHDMELARRERTLVDAGHEISLGGIANA
ncbi:MAG: GDP-mannose 4,6-dehydratase [Rickettsiales bacterium]